MILAVRLLLLTALIMSFSYAFSEADSSVYRIPRVEGIGADGSRSDWGSKDFGWRF
jgi:hypothetical protein